MKNINVIELFASIQGEGNEVGKITTFIRLGGCDFRCPWCDSKHTWNAGQNGEMLPIDTLIEKIDAIGVKHLTFTGGNPCVWKEAMCELLQKLKDKGYMISMETQGSIFQFWINNVDNLVISPKNISDEARKISVEEYRKQIEYIIVYRTAMKMKTVIKVPIFNYDDIEWVKQFVNFEGDYEVYLSVGNDWTDMEDTVLFRTLILDRYKWLIETVIEDEWFVERQASVLPQVHTLIWTNDQGV